MWRTLRGRPPAVQEGTRTVSRTQVLPTSMPWDSCCSSWCPAGPANGAGQTHGCNIAGCCCPPCSSHRRSRAATHEVPFKAVQGHNPPPPPPLPRPPKHAVALKHAERSRGHPSLLSSGASSCCYRQAAMTAALCLSHTPLLSPVSLPRAAAGVPITASKPPAGAWRGSKMSKAGLGAGRQSGSAPGPCQW